LLIIQAKYFFAHIPVYIATS